MAGFPSSKQFLGMGKETTRGTPVAATEWLPIEKIDAIRDIGQLEDKSLRGSAVDTYSRAQGVWHGEVNFEGDVFADSIGMVLKGLFGEEAMSGAGPTYNHVFSLLNSGDMQPVSYTFVRNYGIAVRSYPGGQVAELNFKWTADGKLSYDAKAMSLAESVIAAPTPSYGTLAPVPGWNSIVYIAGVPIQSIEGEWSLKRRITPIHTQSGQQNPIHLWVGALSLTGKIKMLMEADTYYAQYLANTQPALTCAFDAGTASVGFLASKCAWDASVIGADGDYMVLEAEFTGLGNTTDIGASGGFSPCKMTLINARSSVY